MTGPSVGLLVPAGNRVIEREFRLMAPPEISILSTPLLSLGTAGPRTLRAEVASLEEGLSEAVRRLTKASPDVLVYGCAAGSFVGGSAGDARIADRVRRVSNRPLIMAFRAARDALVRLGVKKVGVGTPYTEDMNEELAGYLAEGGIRVTALESIPYERAQEPNVAQELTAKLARTRVEGIFLCCTDLATVQDLDVLERSLAKPVVSSNQAALWACLGMFRAARRVRGYGSLFDVG